MFITKNKIFVFIIFIIIILYFMSFVGISYYYVKTFSYELLQNKKIKNKHQEEKEENNQKEPWFTSWEAAILLGIVSIPEILLIETLVYNFSVMLKNEMNREVRKNSYILFKKYPHGVEPGSEEEHRKFDEEVNEMRKNIIYSIFNNISENLNKYAINVTDDLKKRIYFLLFPIVVLPLLLATFKNGKKNYFKRLLSVLKIPLISIIFIMIWFSRSNNIECFQKLRSNFYKKTTIVEDKATPDEYIYP